MSQASQSPAATHSLDQLLRTGADAARNGNRQGARSLFLALAREHPDDVRVWIGLAGVAASRNEQREALEHVVALDPANQRASLALSRLASTADAPPAGATPILPETLAPLPPRHPTHTQGEAPAVASPADTALVDAEAPARTPFPLMNAIAAALILLLLVALGVTLGRAFFRPVGTAAVPTGTPELVLQPAPGAATAAPGQTALPAPTIAPPSAGQAGVATSSAPAAPTAESPAGTATSQTSALPTAAASAPGSATTAPVAGQPLTLPMGAPIDHDGWTAVLVRPDYAVPLDGAIGDLRPSGRFVLAVVAVSNNSPSPRVLPPDMFLLVDSAGRSFTPVPGASTAYLALYERAQRGDLALEDSFDPVVGLRSVPLIFDLPLDASGLRLTVNGAGPAGWPVGEALPSSAPSGP